VIRANLKLLDDPTPEPLERVSAPSAKRTRAKTSQAKTAGAGLALLDACLRADLPAAGALRSRLALQSAAASAKILRLNADAATLRDLRFAVGDPGGPVLVQRSEAEHISRPRNSW
jgi:hypothetical protein